MTDDEQVGLRLASIHEGLNVLNRWTNGQIATHLSVSQIDDMIWTAIEALQRENTSLG